MQQKVHEKSEEGLKLDNNLECLTRDFLGAVVLLWFVSFVDFYGEENK